MKVLVQNELDGLHPVYDSDMEEKKKLKIGKRYWMETKEARNPEFHKKYWALMKVALEHIPSHVLDILEDVNKFKIKKPEDVHFYVKLKLGMVKKRYVSSDGRVGFEVKSTSFDKMDDIEFQEFYNRALDVVIILTEADRSLMERELVNFM